MTRAWAWLALSLLASAWVLALGSGVQAQPALRGGDYGLENDGWNGLSRFVALARARGLELEPRQGLDLGALGPEDRLIVIFPTSELDRTELSRFVIDGGRVLLADDFGSSASLLDRLGIERVEADPDAHATWYLNRPGLPLFRPGGRHPLLEGVSEVVANHPAALRTEGGAILPYDNGIDGLVYDMRLGRGKVVVVGDASLMINHMLGVKDNARFLENALDYLCLKADPCRPYLLIGDVALTGTYKPRNSKDDGLGEALAEAMGSVNRFLEGLADGTPPRQALYYASLLLMMGLVVFLLTIFSWRRAPTVAPEVGPPPQVRPLSEFEWNLLRYERGGFQANYALPMSILKGEFEALFFGKVAPGQAVPPPDDPRRGAFLRQVAQRFVDEHGEGLGSRGRAKLYRQTHQLLRLFSGIPPRQRLFLDSEAYFSERELMRVYSRSRAILERMGVEYEQRARRRGRGPSGDGPRGA